MIFGIGVDIVNMDRVKRMIAQWGDLFLRRVFTEKEISWCQKRIRSYECFALRFAAKEAFLKAIGFGLRSGIQWKDIEIESDINGKPYFIFYRKAKEIIESSQINHAFLTLSHDKPYAVANVILEVRYDEGCNC
jgi:holo-[acyl-carrier protein] synthase